MPLSKRQFSVVIFVGSIIVLVVFIAIISQLFKHEQVIYTDKVEKTTPELLRTDPVIGSTIPRVLIVAYNNFSCENCRVVHEALRTIASNNPDVAVIWKDFPNQSLFPTSVDAAIAARCGDEQKSFWPYADLLFQNQRELNTAVFTEIANDLQLKAGKFGRCMKKSRPLPLIEVNAQEAVDLSLTGAPTIFINNERFTGALQLHDLQNIVKSLLAEPTP